MAGLFDRLRDEIEAREQQGGLSPLDLLDMPEALAGVVNHIIRNNGMKLEDIAGRLDQSLEKTRAVLAELVQKGYVRQIQVKEETWYKAHFSRKADKTLSLGIWSALEGLFEQLEKD
jgi:hypothetical protein